MTERSEVKRLAETLPQSLICMTLEMNLEDLDAIEQYLADAPESTEKCLPLAVRNVILASMIDPSWQRFAQGPSSTGIAIAEKLSTIPYPNAAMTLAYLTALWSSIRDNHISLDTLLRTAIQRSLPYLVSYALVLAHGLDIDTPHALDMVTDKYSDDTMEHIISRLTPADIDVISVLIRAGADVSSDGYRLLIGSTLPGYEVLSLILLDGLLGPYRERREALPDNIRQIIDILLRQYAFHNNGEAVALIMQFNPTREAIIKTIGWEMADENAEMVKYLLDNAGLVRGDILAIKDWIATNIASEIKPEMMQLLEERYKSL